jgi:hypothetical protein
MKSVKLRDIVLYASLLLAGYGYQLVTNWRILDLNGMKPVPSFNNLDWVLQSAACFKEIGIAVYEPTNEVCPEYNYNYGRFLLYALNFFHLSTSNLLPLGIIAMVTVVIGISLMISTSSVGGGEYSNKILLLLTFFSPPLWLTIAIANFDELIFVLLILTAFSLSLRKELIAILLIGIATLVKFYTLPLFLTLILASKSKVSKLFATFLFFLCGFAITADFALYFNKEKYVGGSNTWWASWGVSWPGHFLNLSTPYVLPDFPLITPLFSYLLGIIVLITAMILIKKTGLVKYSQLKFGKTADSNASNLSNILFWLFAPTATLFYLSGMTMDYRLFFLLAAGCALFGSLESGLAIRRVALILTFITAWGSFGGYGSWTGVLHIAGILGKILSDICVTILVALILEAMRIIKFL